MLGINAAGPPVEGRVAHERYSRGTQDRVVPGETRGRILIASGFAVSLVAHFFFVGVEHGLEMASLLFPNTLTIDVLCCLWARARQDEERAPILMLVFSGVLPGILFFSGWQQIEDARYAAARRARFAPQPDGLTVGVVGERPTTDESDIASPMRNNSCRYPAVVIRQSARHLKRQRSAMGATHALCAQLRRGHFCPILGASRRPEGQSPGPPVRVRPRTAARRRAGR